MLNVTQVSLSSCFTPPISHLIPSPADTCSVAVLLPLSNKQSTLSPFSFNKEPCLKNINVPPTNADLLQKNPDQTFIEKVVTTIRYTLSSISQFNLLPFAYAEELEAKKNRALDNIRALLQTAQDLKQNLTSCTDNLNTTEKEMSDYKTQLNQTQLKLDQTLVELEKAKGEIIHYKKRLEKTDALLDFCHAAVVNATEKMYG